MKLQHYTNSIKYLYYILFFILPFVVLPVNSELFEFNKMLFIYTIAILIGAVWLLRSMQNGKILFKQTPFDIPLGIFFLSQVVSTLFSIDQHTSFFGYYGRFNGGLLSTGTYIFLYYAFTSNITMHKNSVIRTIFGISIISSIAVVLWGIPGKFNRDLSCLLFTSKFNNSCWTDQFRPAERMFSTLGQPNWFGAYLAITYFISIFMVFSTHSQRVRVGSIVGIFLSYLGILLSRSRSSVGSIFPAVTLLGLYVGVLFLVKSQRITSLRKKIVAIILVGLCAVTFIAQTGIPQVDSLLSFSFLKKASPAQPTAIVLPTPLPEHSLEVVGPITESLDIRKIVWQGAWELGRQYPLFGTGVETFGYAYYSVRPVAHNLTSEWDYLYNKAHNEFLNLLATTGWFGLGSYLFFMCWIGFVILKKMHSHRLSHVALLFYMTVSGILTSIWITDFFGFSITVINVYWYMMLAFLAIYNEPNTQVEHVNKKTSLSQIGIVFLLCLWALNGIVNYWLADYKYAQSDIALKSNNSGVAVNLLQEALVLREEHVYQDKLSYALAQYAFAVSYQKEKDKAQQLIEVAENLNLQSIKSSTQNVLYWKTRVKNQFIFYQMSLDKKYLFTGLSALEEAIKLAPTDPKIPYFSATYYSLLYDDEKNDTQRKIYQENSLKSIETALKLKSDYGDAYYLKVQLLRKYGRKSEAKQLLEWYIPRYAPMNEDIKKELKELG